ncbi:hypothetical protein SteCoe_4914 [Stentor coeruleus]|uniref:J domain-containing protein n=1 Tax=Stentor coeruleus TaxID=5963 RepID=A0A1R2CTP7_9CILI|nr:hypothetical protein SteCoe_4914 [Stentor coeruleus]
MKMSSDPKKFPPNLSNCRSRKSSIDSRPRVDSSSSDEMSLFCLKNHEFNFGPDLHPQKRVKTGAVAPQLGKNSDIHFAPDMVCEEVGMEDDDFIHLARSISEQNGGMCLSETCENENFPLVYKCKMGHVWESSEVLLSGSWCWKCNNLLERAKNYASCYGGTCVSKSCELLLEFECRNGHRWRADLTRYMHQKWCKQCILDDKHQRKIKLLQEQQAEEEEQARVQERLFAEARQMMKAENDLQNAESEHEVELMAEEMARRYIESALIKDVVASEQVICVYKVICASENFIKAKYFNTKTRDQATASYRKLARSLHPDKNKHPFAAEAFLKVSSIYAATMANA